MSHDLQTAQTGSGAPTAITPQFIGQIYYDTTNNLVYVAKSLTVGDWVNSLYLNTTAPTVSYFSDWTWQNQGSATLTDTQLGAALYIPGSVAANVRQIVKAVPSSSYQLTVRLAYNGIPVNFQRMYVGWKAALGAAAKLELIAVNMAVGTYAEIQEFRWTNETTYSASTLYRKTIMTQRPWIRIKETGGNIYIYYSNSGNSWYQLITYAKGARFLGVGDYNYLVIAGDNDGTSSDHTIDILNCKLEAV
jgi:hypothetical protein